MATGSGSCMSKMPGTLPMSDRGGSKSFSFRQEFGNYEKRIVVESRGGGIEIGIGKAAAVGHWKVGPSHLDNNDADLGVARGNLGRRKVARCDIVVVPEVQLEGLSARKELPNLGRENAEMRAGIRGGLRSGMRAHPDDVPQPDAPQ